MEMNDIGFDAVEQTIKRLRHRGIDVRMIGDNPDFTFGGIDFLVYKLGQRDHPDERYAIAPKFDGKWNDRLRALVGANAFFDPRATVCDASGRCLLYADGEALMSDNSHFSVFGAGRTGKQMVWLFD
jgi:hypothetical protein